MKWTYAIGGIALSFLVAANVQLDMVRAVNVYDITKGTTPVSTLSGQNVPLTLSDHAMILEF